MNYYERNVAESLSQPGQATRWELVDDIGEQVENVLTATTPAIRSWGWATCPFLGYPILGGPLRQGSAPSVERWGPGLRRVSVAHPW